MEARQGVTACAHLVGTDCGDQQNPLHWYKEKIIELFTEFKEYEQDDESQHVLAKVRL